MPKRAEAKPAPANGDCVRLPDGRIGRVRGRAGSLLKVRVKRASSDTHQFVMCSARTLRRVCCPKGWMSPDGYRRYLRVTLAKMRQRQSPRAGARTCRDAPSARDRSSYRRSCR